MERIGIQERDEAGILIIMNGAAGAGSAGRRIGKVALSLSADGSLYLSLHMTTILGIRF